MTDDLFIISFIKDGSHKRLYTQPVKSAPQHRTYIYTLTGHKQNQKKKKKTTEQDKLQTP